MNKPRLIATTFVGHQPVRIYKVRGLVDQHKCFGRCRPDTHGYYVELDASLKGSMQTDVYTHELIHAIDDVWNLNLTETKVRQLATTLTQALSQMKKRR